jgi:eukaryotic-like serine/threonine-protein kinase
MYAAMGAGRLIAGRYRLQGPIGRGAMGIVWRGRDELLARDVAVKEVQITAHASPADAEAIYQRTLREARTAARLKHPSVVTVYDVVEEGGSLWIIMELIEARSLDRVITEDGPLPPLEAAELGSSLVSALATAHAAGVLHRDVKPSNVLLTQDGKAVLTDFGIATFAEDPSMTQAGLVVGTPGFTSPERVRGDVATPASDLWSVGATLYAAVEGRGPFERIGGSTVITAGVAMEDAPRAPSAGPLGPVIDALLSRDPGSRPDATTAARLLSEAATAARTGARRLGEGWLAAEASTAAARPSSGSAVSGAAAVGAGAAGAGAAAAGGAAAGGAGAGEAVGAVAAGAAAAGDAAAWNSVTADAVGTDALARNSVAADAADAAAAGGTGASVTAAAAEGTGSPASAARAAASDYTPAVPGQASQDAAAQQINEQRAAFLAPPVFAELSMPAITDAGAVGDLAGAGDGAAAAAAAAMQQPVLGSDREPVLWQPMKPPSGGGSGPDAGRLSGQTSSSGGGSSAGGPASPSDPSGPAGGGNGWLRFWNRSGPSKPSSGRWRLMVAGAGIAAIVVAALVGWDIYSHTQNTQALNSSSPPGASSTGGSTSDKSAGGGSAKPGGTHAGTPGASKAGGVGTPASSGHSPSKGKPSAGASRKPSASASTSSGTHASPSASPTASPSASPSPSPSPSTSTGGTAPVLPSGWVWHDFSAAELTATAGFKIGLPAAWTQNLTGQVAHFNQPARNFHLTVNVGVWTYPKPLTEAKYLNKKYATKYNGYTKLALAAVGFKAIGGFRAAPAAELKFSWDKPSAGSYTELVILASLDTKAGVQTYWFSLWAPSASFTAAHGVFHTALKTFRPLPAT